MPPVNSCSDQPQPVIDAPLRGRGWSFCRARPSTVLRPAAWEAGHGGPSALLRVLNGTVEDR